MMSMETELVADDGESSKSDDGGNADNGDASLRKSSRNGEFSGSERSGVRLPLIGVFLVFIDASSMLVIILRSKIDNGGNYFSHT